MSLSVPASGIDARMQSLSSSGAVINPPIGAVVWIAGYGRVRPGAVGTAVVAGHVAVGGRDDVFARLSRLSPGERITVHDASGRPVVYTVTSTRVADKKDVTHDPAVWGPNSSVRRLALITCDDELGYRSDGHRVSNFVAIAEAA